MIGRLEDHIVSRAERILDDAEAAEHHDFVRDIAYQLPMHVIADIVGIPEEERPWVFERTDAVLRALDPASPLTLEDQQSAYLDLYTYAQQLTERKRAEPADDVWTLIAQAEVPGDDGAVHHLEGLELEMFFVILSIAGSETTRNALTQGLLTLLDHPDQLDALRGDRRLVAGRDRGDPPMGESGAVLRTNRDARRRARRAHHRVRRSCRAVVPVG